jgi:hypothetical protein
LAIFNVGPALAADRLIGLHGFVPGCVEIRIFGIHA